MSQFPASDIFRDSSALARGGRTGGPSGSGGRSRSGSRGDVAGSARRRFRRSFFLAPTIGRKRSPSPARSPRLCAALSPTRSASNGCGRRISPSAKAEFLARQIRRPSPSSAALRPFGCRPPGPGFFVPHREERAGDGPAAPGARKRFSKMASNRSKSSPKRETRQALTFETALQLCPHEGVAENVATAFGLIVPDYDAIRAEHASALKRMAEAFEGSLNDKATEMHFQRIVGALVGSAVGAGRFYSTKVGEARAATARAADGGDAEHGSPIGFESKAQRTREFAADMAMQAYALLAAAHGAIDANKDLTGDDWKAYEAPAEAQVEKKAATAQMGAFAG